MDGGTFESEFKLRLLEIWNKGTTIRIKEHGMKMSDGRSKMESVEMIRIRRSNSDEKKAKMEKSPMKISTTSSTFQS